MKEGKFTRRRNRFLVEVLLEGREVLSFLPNSGRMEELLLPGRRVLLREEEGGHRKTSYTLWGIYGDRVLVGVDSTFPNRIFEEALRKRKIPEFQWVERIIPEFFYEGGCFDFFLLGKKRRALVEIKSCSLVKNGVALFPDAPTPRGRRQLEGLIKLQERGIEGVVIFMVQREDGRVFSPYKERDPEFAKILSESTRKGVKVLAYRLRVEPEKVSLEGSIPVRLGEEK